MLITDFGKLLENLPFWPKMGQKGSKMSKND
jgi:hypothetical protein